MSKKKRPMKVRLLSLLFAAVFAAAQQTIVPVQAAGSSKKSESKADAPSNPVYHTDNDTTDWSYVYFGSYPQTEITAGQLTDDITGAEYDSDGDAWVNGTKIRRITISQTNNTSNFSSGGYRYFKWQRIRWRVLHSDSGELMLMADQGLDCEDYHEKKQIITWEDSGIRKWLNETFYHTAFNGEEKNSIVEKTIENEKNPLYSTSGGKNTQDRIYLLSIKDVTNSEYGFYESISAGSKSRGLDVSEYAFYRGVQRTPDGNKSGWWLRSPGRTQGYAACVNSDWQCDRIGVDIDTDKLAVVPVLNIDTSSKMWFMTDDGSSGYGGESILPLTVNRPISKDVKVGEKAVFKVTASGGDVSNYSYEWYYAESPVADGKLLENLNTAGVEITPSDLSMNGIYLYCVVSDGKTKVKSDRAKISITGAAAAAVKKTQKVTAKIKSGNIAYGSNVSLGAKASGNGKLTYKSSSKNVIAVSSAGKLTVKNYGTATITIRAAANDKYSKASKKIKLTVVPKKIGGTNGYVKNGMIYFNWKYDSTASGYQYSIAYNLNGLSNKSSGEKKENSLMMSAAGVSGKISLKVRTYRQVGSKRYYGAWSDALILQAG